MAKAAPAPRAGLRFLDRLILFVAWGVTCGLVYGLGFYTGKGTQERRLGMGERVVRLVVRPEAGAVVHVHVAARERRSPRPRRRSRADPAARADRRDDERAERAVESAGARHDSGEPRRSATDDARPREARSAAGGTEA